MWVSNPDLNPKKIDIDKIATHLSKVSGREFFPLAMQVREWGWEAARTVAEAVVLRYDGIVKVSDDPRSISVLIFNKHTKKRQQFRVYPPKAKRP